MNLVKSYEPVFATSTAVLLHNMHDSLFI